MNGKKMCGTFCRLAVLILIFNIAASAQTGPPPNGMREKRSPSQRALLRSSRRQEAFLFYHRGRLQHAGLERLPRGKMGVARHRQIEKGMERNRNRSQRPALFHNGSQRDRKSGQS